MEFKKCPDCQINQPIDRFRFKNKTLNKRHSYCKDCNSKRTKVYYWKNPDYHRTRSKKWIAENLEYKRKRNAAYMKQYRNINAKKVTDRIKQHYQNNKLSYITRARLRREKECGWVNSLILSKIREQFNNKCFKCKTAESLEFDHHLALKDGGHLVPGNITLLCTKCNNQKRFKNIYSSIEEENLIKFHSIQIGWQNVKDFTICDGIDKVLIENLHYLRCVPSCKHSFLLKYGTKNIGVALFSRPSRQNIKADLELSRFYTMDGTPKNTESYFLGGCIKRLKKNGFRGKIISFADTTEGHQGTIYKATNWKFDGYTSKNYHYEKDGERIHKRQVWNRAKQNNIKEFQQAESEGLIKVGELSKSRWLYVID